MPLQEPLGKGQAAFEKTAVTTPQRYLLRAFYLQLELFCQQNETELGAFCIASCFLVIHRTGSSERELMSVCLP